MSLFGEKCARCGTKTRHEVEGQAVCETCEKEMQLMVEAKAEANRPCPVCSETMAKEIAHMIVIDRCGKCQGVWLDGGRSSIASTTAWVVAGRLLPSSGLAWIFRLRSTPPGRISCASERRLVIGA